LYLITPNYNYIKVSSKFIIKGTQMITYTVIVQSNGTQEWFLNGKLHREDGPAIIDPDGTRLWCRNGKTHREDGPAVIRADGTQFWYLNDEEYTEKEFNKKMKPTCAGKVIEIDGKKYKLTAV